jgi:iron complex transport system ATP-binding protein
MIHVKDLRFRYPRGSEDVLKDISFDSEENTVISLLGPNGTGKTTFLKCICGIYKPTGGSVTVDGKDISQLSGRELSKRIAFVPQSVPLSQMSVFDAVLVGRKPYFDLTATRADIDKVSEVIEAMGMSHIALKYVDRISGGEYQKTNIARAIVQEPSVLILDEPANNLDIANQHLTMSMIMDAVRSRGMCTIMTMHDINLALHYSDKFLFLNHGVVEAYGGKEIITNELIKRVYGVDMEMIEYRGLPLVVPSNSDKYSDERRI